MVNKSPSIPLYKRGMKVFSPLWQRERCEKIDLVLFYVIPALISIEINSSRNPAVVPANAGSHIKNWVPVFTGVTAEIQVFHSFGESEGICRKS